MRIRCLVLLALGLPTIAFAQHRGGSSRLPVDSAATIGQLPNGLRYIIREHRWPEKRAELRLVVNAGSVLEDPDQRGMAHFVEHMAFNGTTHFPKNSLVQYLERIGVRFGAHLNAYTAFDETVYMLTVPTDTAPLLEQGVQILADWAHGVSFDSVEVEKERDVVLEEWRLGLGAEARLRDRTLPVWLRGSRYAERLPIGTKASIETTPQAALRRFYRDWYRPDLMTVVAVGDFDRAAIERLIRARFAEIPAVVDRRPRPVYTVPPRSRPASTVVTDPEATATGVAMIFFKPADDPGTETSYRAGIVLSLYQQMLNIRLSELAQRADPAFLGARVDRLPMIRGVDALVASAAVTDSGAVPGLTALLTEVVRVEQHGFLPAELERAKQAWLSVFQRRFAEREKIESSELADESVRHASSGAPMLGISAEWALVQRLMPGISLDEVNRAAQDWLERQDWVVQLTAPAIVESVQPSEQALLALVDRVRRTKVASYTETVGAAPLISATLPPAAITTEDYDSTHGVTTWTLANGVRVLLKPTAFKADEVHVYAWSPGGRSLVPDSLFRAAVLAVPATQIGGLGAFSGIELQKKLSGKLVVLEPWIAASTEGLTGNAVPRDLPTLLQLIYLTFTAPRADSAAFEALRATIRSQILGAAADPLTALRDAFTTTLFQDHPRTRPWTVAALDSVTLDRALRVYRDRFADASDFTFVFVGAFAPDSIRPLIQRYLGNLPALHRGETFRDEGINPPSGRIEREVHKGVDPKGTTLVAFAGPASPTLDEAFLVTHVLPNLLTMRLREQLREERGGTYGVVVTGRHDLEPTPRYILQIQFGSAPERVDELARALQAELDKLRRTGPTEDELVKIREMLTREWETARTENGFWVEKIATAAQQRRSLREMLALNDRLTLLTADRVRQALIRYLPTDRYVRVSLVPDTAAQATGGKTGSP